MAYLGKTPSQAVRSRYYYTATGGETSLSGSDDNSNVLTFADGNYVDVALNGVTLVAGTDYNTTTANTIAGLTALVASDVVEVIVYDTFSVFSGNVNGDFTVGGTLTAANITNTGNLNFGDNDKAVFGAGSDLQIYHDGGSSWVSDVGAGNLKFSSDGAGVFLQKGATEFMGEFLTDGAVRLYYDNAAKFETTSTGVDAINTAGSSTSRFGSTYNTGSNDGTLVIGNGGSGKAMLRFDYEGTNTDRARIGVSSSGQQLEFYTAGDNERMRIDSSGNLLVGTTSNTPGGAANTTGVALSSGSYGGLISATRDSGAVADFNRKTNDGGIVQFRKDGSIVGSIGTLASNLWIGTGNTALRFGYAGLNAIVPWNTTTNSLTDGTTSLGYSSTRFTDLYLSGGVYLGGTGSANKLDDYEEGTFTPTLDAAFYSGTLTIAGFYRKVGSKVFVIVHVRGTTSVNMTTSGTSRISGMPFVMENIGPIGGYYTASWSNSYSGGGFLNAMAGYGHLYSGQTINMGSNQVLAVCATYFTTA